MRARCRSASFHENSCTLTPRLLMNSSSVFTRLPLGLTGLPMPPAALFAAWAANGPGGMAGISMPHAMPRFRAATTTFAGSLAVFAAPKDQSENAEEDEADLELENDEEQSQLPKAGHRPGADDGSPAARGEASTINPSFP